MLGLPNYMTYFFFGSFLFGLLILVAVMRFSKKSIFYMDSLDSDEEWGEEDGTKIEDEGNVSSEIKK